MQIESLHFHNYHEASLLVIEDNPDHWTIMQAALKVSLPEIEVAWAQNKTQALTYLITRSLLKKPFPKLILLDLYLPDRETGWQLLQELKNPENHYDHVPVVALSNSKDCTDVKKTYAFGAASYIVKPQRYQDWITYLKQMSSYWWDQTALPYSEETDTSAFA
ncbi:response regulator [Siphonobacter curvatus]|nr:response regulator [Siphonobacter curvatus]